MKITKENLGRAVQFANSYGLDKESMQIRMDWAKGEGSTLAHKIVHEDMYPEGASKPAQAYVAAHEWLYPGKAGIDLVCHVDGTCNGLQHGAANTGHEATAEATNCRASTRDKKPEDIYQLATESTINHMHRKGAGDALKIAKYGRQLMKQPVMTTSYGSSFHSAFIAMLGEMTEYYKDLVKKEKQVVRSSMEVSLEKHAGAIISMTKELKEALGGNEGAEISWTAHDGLVVIQNARSKVDEEQEYVGGGEYTNRVDGATEFSQLRALGPNFVHTQDAAMLRETIRTCDFDIVGVHDSYGCRSENWNDAAGP